jgi:hypothetical protein
MVLLPAQVKTSDNPSVHMSVVNSAVSGYDKNCDLMYYINRARSKLWSREIIFYRFFFGLLFVIRQKQWNC